MCTAACVFGLILGELQEIYAAANCKTREMEVFFSPSQDPSQLWHFSVCRLSDSSLNRTIWSRLSPFWTKISDFFIIHF